MTTVFGKLLLAAQKALLGAVTRSLRAVIVDLNEENKILLYFYYNREISQDLKNVAEDVARRILQEFPYCEKNPIVSITRLDFPKKWPMHSESARIIYQRCE